MCQIVLSVMLVWNAASFGQIIGGAEQAEFEPGDVTLFADDFSSVPIGEPSPNFKLMQGAYEIAQFQGKKWIRPLDKRLGLTKPFRFPAEFSIEFTFYAFKDGGPWMNFYLHSEKGLAEWLPEGGERLVQIQVGHEFKGDYVAMWVSEKPTHSPKEVAVQKLKADQIHHIAIQVRRGQLRLFADGQRVAIVPFQPESTIEGMGFYWYHNYATETPYRDAPVLLTDLRVSTYS